MARVGPFTAVIDPVRELKYLSFAIPDEGVGEDVAAHLPDVKDAFRRRARLPRIEVIDELTPELPAVLEAGGWQLSERMPLMTCEPGGLREPPAPAGLEIEALGPDAPDRRVRDFLAAQREGFGDPEPVTTEHVERFRGRAVDRICVAGVVDGMAVATALSSPVSDRVVEIGGVATVPAHRGRGIAAALSARVTADAFAAGAQVVWLTAADERAERIYARLGFGVAGYQSNYDFS